MPDTILKCFMYSASLFLASYEVDVTNSPILHMVQTKSHTVTYPKVIQPECRELGGNPVCFQSHSPTHDVFLPQIPEKEQEFLF